MVCLLPSVYCCFNFFFFSIKCYQINVTSWPWHCPSMMQNSSVSSLPKVQTPKRDIQIITWCGSIPPYSHKHSAFWKNGSVVTSCPFLLCFCLLSDVFPSFPNLWSTLQGEVTFPNGLSLPPSGGIALLSLTSSNSLPVSIVLLAYLFDLPVHFFFKYI